MDIRDIKAVLPHRYPFLLVDRVIEIEEGHRGVGLKNLTANEAFFNGHYPDYPIMPGVLIIEALAQLAGLILLQADEAKGRLPLFAGIEKARFKRQVIPGDVLRLEVEVIAQRRNYLKVSGKASVEAEIACEAVLTFMTT